MLKCFKPTLANFLQSGYLLPAYRHIAEGSDVTGRPMMIPTVYHSPTRMGLRWPWTSGHSTACTASSLGHWLPLVSLIGDSTEVWSTHNSAAEIDHSSTQLDVSNQAGKAELVCLWGVCPTVSVFNPLGKDFVFPTIPKRITFNLVHNHKKDNSEVCSGCGN